MKYKLSEKELELIKRVSDETITDYEIDNEGYIKVENLICATDDLYREVKRYEEEYNDLKQRMDCYYVLKEEWAGDD